MGITRAVEEALDTIVILLGLVAQAVVQQPVIPTLLFQGLQILAVEVEESLLLLLLLIQAVMVVLVL